MAGRASGCDREAAAAACPNRPEGLAGASVRERLCPFRRGGGRALPPSKHADRRARISPVPQRPCRVLPSRSPSPRRPNPGVASRKTFPPPCRVLRETRHPQFAFPGPPKGRCGFLTIFRVGYGLAVHLQRDVRRWRQGSWFSRCGWGNNFFGAPWGEMLAGLCALRPRFYATELEANPCRHRVPVSCDEGKMREGRNKREGAP